MVLLVASERKSFGSFKLFFCKHKLVKEPILAHVKVLLLTLSNEMINYSDLVQSGGSNLFLNDCATPHLSVTNKL